MTEDNYKFTSGNLTGIYQDYHNITMKNELKAGQDAYQLGWAGTKRSGPSFGRNQMDIAHNKHGREVLLDILKTAVNARGHPYLNEQEIQSVERALQKPERLMGKKIGDVFEEIDKIQAALSSNYGKQASDKAYIREITSRARHVERFIASVRYGPGRKFVESRVGMCYLFDYENQYGLSIGGPLHRYLNGEEVTLKSGRIIPAFTRDGFTTLHFKDFLKRLKYYSNNPGDVSRRLENIDKYLAHATKLTVQVPARITPERRQRSILRLRNPRYKPLGDCKWELPFKQP